jgi:hypothetical protein
MVINNIDDAIERQYPEKSDSRFFPKGWDGKVEFFEWLKEIPRKVRNLAELIIVDPFIDEEVLRFIPRFGKTDIHYLLIANTKARKESEAKRHHLKNEFNKFFKTMKFMNVTVYDVKKEKQLIHDRYILLKDSEGWFVKGFHLSNSIQKASDNFPLLVTEIPRDAMKDIGVWLSENIDTELEMIWSSSDIKPSRKLKSTTTEMKEFQDLSEGDILELLKVKTGESWNEICENAYHNNNTQNNLYEASKQFTTNDWNNIYQHFDDYFNNIETDEITDDSHFILQCLQENDFVKMLDSTDRLFDYLHDVYSASPSMHYLIDISVRSQPAKLIETSIEIFKKLNISNDNNSGIGIFFNKILSSLNYLLRFHDCEKIWIDSNIDLLTGIAVSSLSRKIIDGKLDIKDAIDRISNLEQEKFLDVLKKWIYELRIEDNRRTDVEDPWFSTRKEIFEKIIELWPSDADNELIKSTLTICGGPGDGNWAASTYNELFSKLIDTQKISLDSFWGVIKDMCDYQLDFQKHFSHTDSIHIFEVFSYIASKRNVTECIDYLTKFIRSDLRQISKPFSASISFDDYMNSLQRLHEILIILVCLIRYSTEIDMKIISLKHEIISVLMERELFLTTSNTELNDNVTTYLGENKNQLEEMKENNKSE